MMNRRKLFYFNVWIIKLANYQMLLAKRAIAKYSSSMDPFQIAERPRHLAYILRTASSLDQALRCCVVPSQMADPCGT